jgi:hypothetical protein
LTGQAFEFKFCDHGQEPPKRSATSLEVLFIHPGAQTVLGAGGGQGRTVEGVRLADARARLPGLPLGNGSAGRLRRSDCG